MLNEPAIIWPLSIFLQFLKMAPTPNFGVFLDFEHPFLNEVDFKAKTLYISIVEILLGFKMR